MCRKPVAKEYIELTDAWNNTSKETMVNNVLNLLCERYPECNTFSGRNRKLEEITNSKKEAVYAWVNLSRSDVRIPLLKLCMIAVELNVDVMEFLKPNNEE